MTPRARIGPLGPFPGGELSGTIASEAVSDWSFAHDVMIVQLETRPERPYSVNLGCIDYGEAIYVGTSNPETSRWVSHLEADPRVRLRVGDTVYPLRAERVTDTTEYNAAGLRFFRKYDLDYDPEESAGVLFRLDPR